MQSDNSDNLHDQPQEISYHLSRAPHFFSHQFNKLFRNPWVIVLLVWGLLFLILGVALAYGQGAGHAINRRHTVVNSRRAINHAASRNKTEVVEIFNAGEDQVVPPQSGEANVGRRRHALFARRQERRRRAHGWRAGGPGEFLRNVTLGNPDSMPDVHWAISGAMTNEQ
jgi:hypothetical protein